MSDPYEKWAGLYNPVVEPLLAPLKREIVKDCVRSGLRRVLDIGSGTGTLCGMLWKKGIEAVALDPSPSMIRISRGSRLNSVALVRGRGEGLPFFGRSFEGIVMSLVLHENVPLIRKKILHEAVRVLTPRGSIFILDYDRPGNLLGKAASSCEYAVEAAVGDDHFRNYRLFMQGGALTGLLAKISPPELYRQYFFWGSISLVKYSPKIDPTFDPLFDTFDGAPSA
jgi:ubiquinone/menaquinone biosynthesis C-methylase UbiE